MVKTKMIVFKIITEAISVYPEIEYAKPNGTNKARKNGPPGQELPEKLGVEFRK